MFNKKTMVLYCGGSPGLAPAAPQSPGGGVGGVGVGGGNGAVGEGGLALLPGGIRSGCAGLGCAEGPRALIGGGRRAGPLSLIGPQEAAARALIGQAAATPEDELDGCEPEPELPAAASSCSSSAASSAAASPTTPGPVDPLRQVTLELVASYLREAADQETPKQDGGCGGGGGGGKFLQGLLGRFGPCASGEAETAARALETLRRVCDDIREKHQLAFQGMLRKVQIDKADDLKVMSEVATQVFNDGITNWGRIVTLISFGAFVAKHLKSINQESGINTLAEIITEVLVTEKREWLLHHNGWEGFVKFFHVEDLEGSIRNILVAFAGVAGLGASLAYLIR
ncbi:PREDICTED: induced myeloid leukemia cell differentiation protein Mcl-1 [Thamnophis sirtalis]|uniref:Induced myeloid leukemia cell differentiation protein Mcl-1 n=1 Tax=Thamnophis sirtalis TaxID=35019 RepID=A0A6I9X718_9SAUR|nr:PREDICTED: induced myeloid leukemia cell differentiation protein Mcl-1 [Thamnophis sirtalis]